MKTHNNKNIGIERLIQRFRAEFEIEENINHYSFDDFLKAQRKYLKFMLEGNSAQNRWIN